MTRNQTRETELKINNQAAFKRLLKIGIYKSLYVNGVISRTQFMKLIENQEYGIEICR